QRSASPVEMCREVHRGVLLLCGRDPIITRLPRMAQAQRMPHLVCDSLANIAIVGKRTGRIWVERDVCALYFVEIYASYRMLDCIVRKKASNCHDTLTEWHW